MAPGSDGNLFVSIPKVGGSVLVLLDSSGRPHPGWPITIKDSAACDLMSPVGDGSVRIVCTLGNPGNMFDPIRAFAFDEAGRTMDGWPIDLIADGYASGRVIGDELSIHAWRSLGDVIEEGQPASLSWIMTVAADGTVRNGAPTSFMPNCCSELGSDAIAVAVVPVGEPAEPGFVELSQVSALDVFGLRTGWPDQIEGIASGPAFGPDGRTAVTVGSYVRRTSRILAFDGEGEAVSASSAALPIATGALFEPGVDGPYECGVPGPKPPLIAQDGTMYLFSEVDPPVFALDPVLAVIRGWPYQPPTPLVRRDPWSDREGISCPSLGVPAVGPDTTLYLPLQARDTTVGGSIEALGPEGSARPGWPVALRRPGSEFWSVVVGSDGTVYALAIEPETGDASSASIVAIALDGIVLYTTTIIDR